MHGSARCSDTANALQCSRVCVPLPSASQQSTQGLCLILQWSALATGPRGHGAAVFAPHKEETSSVGAARCNKKPGQPHLVSGGKHNSPHPGWGFRSRISLGRKGGRGKKEGEQKKALSSYYSLSKTKPGRGTQHRIRKTHFLN